MFAVEHAGVEPDIMVMAKGIASGFPIAAIGARADLMAQWHRGAHGGTYGANPMGCAAALATIDVIHVEQLVDALGGTRPAAHAGSPRAAGSGTPASATSAVSG